MQERIRQIAIDTLQINLPWSGSFAIVNVAEFKDWFSILTMAIGAVCTILVTIHKLKGKDDEK